MRRGYYDDEDDYGYGYGSYGHRGGRGMMRQDGYAQAAGALGVLTIILGALMVVKDALGLGWPAMTMLTAGTLVALGWVAWQIRKFILKLFAPPAKAEKAKGSDVATSLAVEAVDDAPAHEELTSALRRAGAIGREEIIRRDEVTTERVSAVPGDTYDFEMPGGRTHEDVSKRLGKVASVFGVTRLHMQVMTSRESERRVRLLKLNEPPFSRPFVPPTRQEIESFAGVPFGHDVSGELAGVSSFDKASMLIGGMTQTGKTTLVNGLITCLMIAYGETDFELYLLDGKLCGLTRFEKIATRYESSDDPSVFENLLDELNAKVDSRYTQMTDAIRQRRPAPDFKPVIFVIDEAADFYSDDGSKEGKEQTRRIVEKSRSLVAKALESGVSTIMLTQRPSQESIPVKVREQFLYRMCLYVASEGSAKVALGDSYFDTVAPIHPALLDPGIQGQAVLFAHGKSTLIRGFNLPESMIWQVVDERAERQAEQQEQLPDTPLTRAISVLKDAGVDFMPTAKLAGALGIEESDPTAAGKALSKFLGVAAYRGAKGARGYRLADLEAAARSES